MRVAVAAPLDLTGPGGVEVHIVELARALRKLGVEVEIFSKDGEQGRRGLEELRAERFDIIHTHGSFFSRRLLKPILRRSKDLRHVHTLHGVAIDYLVNCRAWLNWRCYTGLAVEGFCSRRADHVIAVSESVRRRALGIFKLKPDKISVIYNGYALEKVGQVAREEVRRELKFEADDVVLLFVGRGADKVKGAAAVTAAVQELRQEFTNVYLLAAPGYGFEEVGWLRRTGPVGHGEVSQYYVAADIFVNASLNEGMPLTVIEAMAAGLAVAAAPVGGIPEVVTTEESGLLLRADRDDLVDQLRRLIKDKLLRRRLGAKAREAVRDLTWKNLAQQTIKVYETVLDNSGL